MFPPSVDRLSVKISNQLLFCGCCGSIYFDTVCAVTVA